MSQTNTLAQSRSRSPARRENDRPADLANSVKPLFEIKETPDAFGATVYLPGVAKDGLEITAEEGQIRIVGRRAWKQPERWTALHRESVDAPFELVLAHENAVDLEKTAAELRDGILRISLPKHEAIKPRKIAVK